MRTETYEGAAYIGIAGVERDVDIRIQYTAAAGEVTILAVSVVVGGHVIAADWLVDLPGVGELLAEDLLRHWRGRRVEAERMARVAAE